MTEQFDGDPEDAIQTLIDNWVLYCPAHLKPGLDEVIRLALVGETTDDLIKLTQKAQQQLAESGITLEELKERAAERYRSRLSELYPNVLGDEPLDGAR